MAEAEETGASGNAETARESDADRVVSARQRFQRISEDVRRGAERASSEIRRGAEVARGRYEEAAESAREGYDKVRQNAGQVSREVGFFVRDNPGKAVLIAAGVGFLLGLLMRRGGDYEE